MTDIAELAEIVRRGIEQDAADIEQAWQVRGFNSERLATMQGTTVLMSGWRAHRDVAARRQLLDTVLAWEHYEVDDPWYCCPASAAYRKVVQKPPYTCTCGRDERVHAVLQTLATPYQETHHG